MSAMRTIDVDERRRRLGRRHALAPSARAGDVVEAAERLVCLHATDPVGLNLSVWSRVEGFVPTDLDRATYDERSLVRLMAMRRTQFVFPQELVPAAVAGAGLRVAAPERNRLVADIEKAGLHADGHGWVAAACAAVLELLADGRARTNAELRAELPLLEGAIAFGEGKSWASQAPIAPRVVTLLWASGEIMRAADDGPFYVSKPRWTTTANWLGAPVDHRTPGEGVTELVRRWLQVFGPGTEQDLRWWLGGKVTDVRRSLADLGAVAVDLDGVRGHVLPDDLEPEPPIEPWTALLGPLDPTTMGWTERAWYLGAHKAQLFDTAGNAGPTMWCDGRIVGGWVQDHAGEVVLVPLEDVGGEAMASFASQAAALTEWFGGRRCLPRYPSPIARTALEGR